MTWQNMRILFFSSIFPHGTARVTGTFNLQRCRALARENEVRIVAPRSFLDVWKSRHDNENGDRWVFESYGLTVSYPRYFYTPGCARQFYGEMMWWSVRRHLQRVVSEFQPEAVISYWAHPDGEVALRVARSLSIPSVLIVGGSDVLILPQDRRRRSKIQRVLRESSAVVTVSEGLRQAVIELGVDPQSVLTNYQGVDENLFYCGDSAVARAALSLPTDRKLLLWIGRMVPVKGLETLIAAFDLAHQRDTQLMLLLVGDGPLRAEIQADVNRRGLREHVLFAGAVPQEQLGDWYRASDLVVLSSWSEGLPNVLREALACGRPFVSTDVGSVREIADSKGLPRFAELVPAGDATAMATAIEQALHPAYRTSAELVPTRSWRETARGKVALLERLRQGLPAQSLTNPHTQTNDLIKPLAIRNGPAQGEPSLPPAVLPEPDLSPV
jgi:glycosyltransferase involved in cell wall biosynthesis